MTTKDEFCMQAFLGSEGPAGAAGKDGLSPFVNEAGNWQIGQIDTGVKAAGKDGRDGAAGLTPFVNESGNWQVGPNDTGVKARAKDGKDGAAGKDGLSASVTVEGTETLEPEEEAEVINRGTGLDARLLFRIPCGARGQSTTLRVPHYDTFDDLLLAHPTGTPQEAYLVGTENFIYIWNTEINNWEAVGCFGNVLGIPEQINGVKADLSAETAARIDGDVTVQAALRADIDAAKTDVLTSAKEYTDGETAKIQLIRFVQVLPEQGESKYLYAVTQDVRTKENELIVLLYLWTGTEWAVSGVLTGAIDLTEYYTKTEVSGLLEDKADKAAIVDGEPTSSSSGGQVTSARALFSLLGGSVGGLSTTAKTVVGAINELDKKPVVIPGNVYTKETLIAGTNIEFETVIPGGIDEHCKGCFHFDADVLDASPNGMVFSGASGGVNTTVGKFGGGCFHLQFERVTSVVQSAAFCYEFFYNIAGQTAPDESYLGFIYVETLTGRKDVIQLKSMQNTYELQVYYCIGSSATGTKITDIPITSNTWKFLALQMSENGVLSVWADGKKLGELDTGIVVKNHKLQLQGYNRTHFIDELRISDVGRYVQDFTPPERAFTVPDNVYGYKKINYTGPSLDSVASVDLSNVTTPVQAFKSGVLGWLAPDYTRPVELTSGQEYTADKSGWVQVYSCVFSYSVYAEVVVNGQVMVYSTVAGTVGANWTSGGTCYVDKGDVYKATANTVLRFYPCKGEI